jgi:hypothetical protein
MDYAVAAPYDQLTAILQLRVLAAERYAHLWEGLQQIYASDNLERHSLSKRT